MNHRFEHEESTVNTNKKLLAILILASLPVASSQAGWMRTEGEVAVSSGLGYKDNANFFDRQGTSMRNTCGSGYNVPLFAEYGLSYYNTIYAATSFDSFNCANSSQQGFNDVETGIRGRTDYIPDHNWEVAAIFPQHLSPNGAALQPKKFGLKAGLYSSSRLDPYQNFLSDQEASKSTLSYGAGLRYWIGDVPGEVWGFVSYGRTLSNADWSKEIGGWFFTARLDAKNALGKTYTSAPGNGLVDLHDTYRLLSGQLALVRSLTLTDSVNFTLDRGIAGQNTSYVSGVFVTYSKLWRN